MASKRDRPRICISLDRHWMYRLGLDWLTYQRLIRRAGGMPSTIHYHRHGGISNAASFDLHTHGPFDGLLLGGGIDVDPTHYRSGVDVGPINLRRRHRDEFELTRQFLTTGRPILGIAEAVSYSTSLWEEACAFSDAITCTAM